jgi:8-oxo-dGTP pyrophosphatase MutT (NUDIX family)
MTWRRRASAVIIEGDRILLVRISDRGQSWWCLPGGTVEASETPEQAIVRELDEELKLKVDPYRPLYEAPLPDETGIDYGILTERLSGPPRLGGDPAVVGWGWFTLNDAPDSWQVELVRNGLDA